MYIEEKDNPYRSSYETRQYSKAMLELEKCENPNKSFLYHLLKTYDMAMNGIDIFIDEYNKHPFIILNKGNVSVTETMKIIALFDMSEEGRAKRYTKGIMKTSDLKCNKAFKRALSKDMEHARELEKTDVSYGGFVDYARKIIELTDIHTLKEIKQLVKGQLNRKSAPRLGNRTFIFTVGGYKCAKLLMEVYFT